jgi:beta-N-acetylhexosaminidase
MIARGRATLFAGFVLFVLAAAACDGQDEPAVPTESASPVATETPSRTPESSPSLTTTPTATHTATPTASSTATPTPTASTTLTPSPTITATATPTVTPAPVSCGIAPADRAAAEGWLAQLSMEQKVGVLIFAGLPAPQLDDEWREFIRTHSLSNFAPLSRNLVDRAQMRDLRAALDETVRAAGLPFGALLGLDEEGGVVQRLSAANGFTDLPGADALGATRDAGLAREVGAAFASFLRSVGIGIDFAPVLDVNDEPRNPVIGRRAFGDTPGLVGRMGTAFIEGLQCGGVAAVAKHFPGHGSTTQDSHLQFPRVDKSEAEIERSQLPPFAQAIVGDVAGVMLAHVDYPALDEAGLPASVSAQIIDGLLRRRIGFDGLVITDDLGMVGILSQFGAGEAAVRAVEAGADAVIVAGPLEITPADLMARLGEVYDALHAAANAGRITADRLDQAVLHVLEVRARFGGEPEGEPADSASLVQRIARAAIAVDGPTLPAAADCVLMLPAIFGEAPERELAALLEMRGITVVIQQYDPSRAVSTAGPCSLVVVLERLRYGMLGPGTVLVATRSAYVLAGRPEGASALASFGALPEQIEALADVLAGNLQPTGVLPAGVR